MLNILFSLCFLIAEEPTMHTLVKSSKAAALSTSYEKGTFTSFVPYVVDADGRPIILVSEISVHTDNLDKNPSCSIMVSKINEESVYESPRITLIGKMTPVPEKEVEEAKKLYLDRHPDAEILFQLADFHLYRMEIEKVYYVGGFASAEWVELKDYQKGFKP
jgi:putative heme iron utilization protein